jgi:type IV pilus assembly protein PilY1
LPTYDTTFPTDDPDDAANTSAALPNWDNLAPATPVTIPQTYPPYSDGHANGDQSNEGFSLFLDDVAKFGFDIDMKTTGTDAAGGSYQDPKFLKQNLNTYTIGFTVANQMLQDAASYGNGLYIQANTVDELTTALQSSINHVFDTSSSSSSVASNSTRLTTETKIYQAKFNSLQWSGELLAFPLNSDGTVGTASSNAATSMPAPASRTIFTIDPAATTKGVPFTWTGTLPGTTTLTATQQAALNKNITGTTDNLGIERVAYLRGDRGLEVQNGGTFRNRANTTGGSPLGDIVNSDPLFVGTPNYRYHLLPGTEGTAYRDFRESSAYKSRASMLYVGANDGMLHAFDAGTMAERFAFIPNDVFSKLSALTATNYGHNFYVDGSPRSGDAYINGSWKTILVGGLRSGGKSIFALDVTSPSSFSASDILWEFTDATNLGYTYSQPTIVRLNSGAWAAVFGNGYNSAAQTAQLFIVNLADGTLIRRIDTGVGDNSAAGVPNGLSTPAPVDVDGDRITDYIYAGDLYGNMWKFDLTASNSNNWNVAYKQGSNTYPLYRATDSSGNSQPITSRPELGVYSISTSSGGSSSVSNGTMVYFGTGKYFETGDNSIPATPPVQTFYGIRDNGSRVTGGRSDLQQQSIQTEQTVNGRRWRTVSETALANTKRGWYMNLVSPVSGAQGERSVSTPQLRDGRIIFTTLIPDPDPCSFGGRSWLMELDGETGARLTYAVFDLNGDGKVDSNDTLPDGTFPSGEGFDDVVPTPTIIGAGEVEYKYMSGSSGDITTVTERGDSRSARQSWRQIR